MGRLALLTLLVGLVSGCGAGAVAGPASGPERYGAASRTVNDEAFPSAVRDLLVSAPRSQERSVRLSGVVGRQLDRAAVSFRAHQTDRALNRIAGALSLVGPDDLSPEILGKDSLPALRDAARELASRGDEGRARAAYELLARLSSGPEKADAEAHLEAIRRWTQDTVGHGGPVASAGGLARVATRHYLYFPSTAAKDEASGFAGQWVRRSLALDASFRATRTPPPREEGQEAFRALQVGGLLLVAVHMRDLDAAGAVRSLDQAQARDLVPAELARDLEGLAQRPDASRYVDVYRMLRLPPRRDGREDDELLEEREIFRFADFRVAQEAYRLDPTMPEAAVATAIGLQVFGMTDASPTVLADAARAHPDPRVLSAFTSVILQGLASEAQAEDAEGARRTFRAALPVLAVAEKKEQAVGVQPSAARVRAVMGELEIREGRLDDARKHLAAAASAEPSGDVLLSLARIDWHDKKANEALGELKAARTAPGTAKNAALEGEILLLTADIQKDQGQLDAARTTLSDALRILTKARATRDSDERARIELTLSRVLDRFGAAQPATRAIERAVKDASRDKSQAAATIGHLVGRAFVRGDLSSARDGLTRALAADLALDDVVYYALWVRLLERQLRTPTDGVAARVFASVPDDGRWVAKLAAFGAGKLRGEELLAAAHTPSQKTEALFYAAMDRRVSGDAKGFEDGLRQVAASPALDLMEMGFAKDILSGGAGQVGGPLPKDVQIP